MRNLDVNTLRFFSGQSHPMLASGIADYLSVPLEDTTFEKFTNDNLFIQLGASVRGRNVFIVQSLIPPTSDNLLELLMMLDIAHGAGACEIHAIIPYFSYARSDKKDAPRISITARLIADLLKTAGATHIMTMTLHSAQVHGFFSLPTDPLTARPLFVWHYDNRHYNPKDTIVVSPDVGRAKSATRFAFHMGLSVATANKLRLSDHSIVIDDTVTRQVRGFKRALIYDDEIVTGTTVITLCDRLIETGITEISVICTHGVFTGDSLQLLQDIPEVKEIVASDTVPMPEEKRVPKLTTITVAPVFGEAIWRNSTQQSIGDLFTYGESYDGETLPNN